MATQEPDGSMSRLPQSERGFTPTECKHGKPIHTLDDIVFRIDGSWAGMSCGLDLGVTVKHRECGCHINQDYHHDVLSAVAERVRRSFEPAMDYHVVTAEELRRLKTAEQSQNEHAMVLAVRELGHRWMEEHDELKIRASEPGLRPIQAQQYADKANELKTYASEIFKVVPPYPRPTFNHEMTPYAATSKAKRKCAQHWRLRSMADLKSYDIRIGGLFYAAKSTCSRQAILAVINGLPDEWFENIPKRSKSNGRLTCSVVEVSE